MFNPFNIHGKCKSTIEDLLADNGKLLRINMDNNSYRCLSETMQEENKTLHHALNEQKAIVDYTLLEKEGLEKKIVGLEETIANQTKELHALLKKIEKMEGPEPMQVVMAQHPKESTIPERGTAALSGICPFKNKTDSDSLSGEIVDAPQGSIHVSKSGKRTKTGVKYQMPPRDKKHKVRV